MEAFASIVLLVIAMFVYAGFTAVTEKLDEIIERPPPPRQPGHTAAATDHRAAHPVQPQARGVRCRDHRHRCSSPRLTHASWTTRAGFPQTALMQTAA
jgi:hypothetical protein